jgi:hypothetical protein
MPWSTIGLRVVTTTRPAGPAARALPDPPGATPSSLTSQRWLVVASQPTKRAAAVSASPAAPARSAKAWA